MHPTTLCSATTDDVNIDFWPRALRHRCSIIGGDEKPPENFACSHVLQGVPPARATEDVAPFFTGWAQ